MIRPLARDVLLVAAGGAVGSVLRWGVTHVVATGSGWPWATLGCNVLGAFLLGLLLEALTRPGDETPRAHSTRLVLGTGLLGGFTTYSAFAQDLWEQLAAGGTGQAVLTAAGIDPKERGEKLGTGSFVDLAVASLASAQDSPQDTGQ